MATITPEDAFLVHSDLPFVTAHTIRMATLHAPKQTFAGFGSRYGVLFVGNGFNPTNYISVEWFFEASETVGNGTRSLQGCPTQLMLGIQS